MSGLSHLQSDRPCDGFKKKCGKCRFRPWCILYRSQDKEKERAQ